MKCWKKKYAFLVVTCELIYIFLSCSGSIENSVMPKPNHQNKLKLSKFLIHLVHLYMKYLWFDENFAGLDVTRRKVDHPGLTCFAKWAFKMKTFSFYDDKIILSYYNVFGFWFFSHLNNLRAGLENYIIQNQT